MKRLVCNHPLLFLYKSSYDLEEIVDFRKEIINSSNKLKILE